MHIALFLGDVAINSDQDGFVLLSLSDTIDMINTYVTNENP
jgi:hypothetical protein